MTVIAYRDGIMAADKQTSSSGMAMTVSKIRRLRDGRLVGAAGNASMCRQLLEWLELGGNPKDYPDASHSCTLLVVTPDGSLFLLDEGPYPIELADRWVAIGHGRDFAMGAMAEGADAVRAVEVASQFDIYCGRGVDAATLDPDAAA